ncbi:MAG: 3-ketoacyl-ACP reductase [Pirellulaceae bacterium]|nr:MAG: 3-ketoacyl-ACP reductase [Pirellulaceae bacterium]
MNEPVDDRDPNPVVRQTQPSGRLAGKVIVVMGGTGGIGAAVVEACFAGGATLVAAGLMPKAATPLPWLPALRHRHVRLVIGDARYPETSVVAVRLAIQTWGRLDGLVHVAGGSGRALGDGPLHEIPWEGWTETLRWNLETVYHSNRAALEPLMRAGQGSIVNITSVLADHPAPRHFATHAYAAAKAAVVGLTRAAAAFYAPWNIRVNAVAPGLIQTPMAERALADDQIQEFLRRKQPLGQGGPGLPSDVAAAVVYLLSDESRLVTGQVIAVDGGWTVTDSGAVAIRSSPHD